MDLEFFKIAHAGAITDAPTFAQIGVRILNFLLSVLASVVIIMTLVSGLLYFFSFGSERAMQTAKKSFTWGIVGTIVAISGLIILKFISGMLK